MVGCMWEEQRRSSGASHAHSAQRGAKRWRLSSALASVRKSGVPELRFIRIIVTSPPSAAHPYRCPSMEDCGSSSSHVSQRNR